MARRKDEETAGNAVGSQAAFDRQMYNVGIVVYGMEQTFDMLFEHDVVITGIKIRTPANGNNNYIGVISAIVNGEAVVAFQSGDTFDEVLLGVLNRLRNRSVVWKEDKWKGN